MEDTLVLNKSEILVPERSRTTRSVTKLTDRRTITDRSPGNLEAEGGENFSDYINWIGSDQDASVLVLSSKHHYYYDVEELQGVTTLINLKRLNFMNHMESFLHVVGNILSPDARFVGCFADKKARKGIGMPSRIYKRLINFLDYRIDIEIDKRNLVRLFESCGFMIIDMTEINGLTYFTTRKCGN